MADQTVVDQDHVAGVVERMRASYGGVHGLDKARAAAQDHVNIHPPYTSGRAFWEAVRNGLEAQMPRVPCAGKGCEAAARRSNRLTVKTSLMSAPAFYYYCDACWSEVKP